jgi:hypothetical protein
MQSLRRIWHSYPFASSFLGQRIRAFGRLTGFYRTGASIEFLKRHRDLPHATIGGMGFHEDHRIWVANAIAAIGADDISN